MGTPGPKPRPEGERFWAMVDRSGEYLARKAKAA